MLAIGYAPVMTDEDEQKAEVNGSGANRVTLDVLCKSLKSAKLCPEAWQWLDQIQDESEISEEHIKLVYRCNAPVHDYKTEVGPEHRKHCKDNPKCLRFHMDFLGTSNRNIDALEAKCRKELATILDVNYRTWIARLADGVNPRRVTRSAVGLVNLGATCYVNSLLQMLYWNVPFRRAVYRWKDPDGSDQILTYLQKVFTYMNYSRSQCHDPRYFIDSLGLSYMQQQDADEFFKLCLHKFEDFLSPQNNLSQTDGMLIRNEFSGTLAYRTTCNKCKIMRETKSKFYEIEVTPGGTLHDSLVQSFLNVETMTGVNMYACSQCGRKRNATRVQTILTLPNVITFHVLRFTYDPLTIMRQKNDSVLRFPESIDMALYSSESTQTTDDATSSEEIYDLQAIILHKGKSASEGHYITQIYDVVANQWIQFDDHNVDLIDRSAKLRKDGSREYCRSMPGEDMNDVSQQARLRRMEIPPGMLESKTCYILSYRKRKAILDAYNSIMQAPKQFRQEVEAENIKLDTKIAFCESKFDSKLDVLTESRDQCWNMYRKISPHENDTSYVWIPTTWLEDWFEYTSRKGSQTFEERINTKKFCCPHGRLDPEFVLEVKHVKTATAENLIRQHGIEGPVLRGMESICKECVKEIVVGLKHKDQLLAEQETVKQIIQDLKSAKTGNEYVVDKDDLNLWLKSLIKRSRFYGRSGYEKFNLRTICKHGYRSIDSKKMIQVSLKCWEILKLQFVDHVECSTDLSECLACKEELREQIQRKANLRILATKEREQFKFISSHDHVFALQSTIIKESVHVKEFYVEEDVLTLINDFGPQHTNFPNGIYFAVPHLWIKSWRKWVKKPQDYTRPKSLDLADLVCRHGKLKENVANHMVHFFKYTQEESDQNRDEIREMQLILLTAKNWMDLKNEYDIEGAPYILIYKASSGRYSSFPKECIEGCCVIEQLETSILVRKILDRDLSVPQKDYLIGPNSKRRRTLDQNEDAGDSKNEESTSSRRSTRIDCKRIVIGWEESVATLRRKIADTFGITSLDSELWLNKQMLNQSTQRLTSYGIRDGDIIDFVVKTTTSTEAGFEGTNLLSRYH